MEVEEESLSVGRIAIDEVNAAQAQGRDIFAERVEKRITEILEKYGCMLVVTEFQWRMNAGPVSGKITVVRKPASG